MDEKLINSIIKSYKKGKSIRRNLGMNSKLVIEQKLPYLCVFRFVDKPDKNMASLLTTQGAYLVASSKLDIKPLLKALIEEAILDFKSYMIVEIWENRLPSESNNIRILYPAEKVTATIDSLENGFKEFSNFLPQIKIITDDTKKRYPPNLSPLIDLDELKKTGTLLIGIAIPSIFRDPETNFDYPLFFRKIRRKFADVIKMAAFEFVRIQADNKFSHYLMLGKTRLDTIVRSADRKMAEINERMDFILRVTPVNTNSEWENFQKNKFSKPPHFIYRLISLDPELEKRKLFNIPLEDIEHPTLAFLLRDKRMELEKQLIMLEERGTKTFLYNSQSIYGRIDEETKNEALSLLEDKIPNEQLENEMINSVDFARAAMAELDKFRQSFPGLDLQVKIKENVTGLIVSGPELSIGKDLSISAHRLNALIQHEVGTHMLTYCNGHAQPIKLMYAGFAGYEQLQEGMAVLAEYFVDGLNINRLKLLAARVMAVDALINGSDFIETYNLLSKKFGFSRKTAFNITMRVHRGGGLTKDAIYLQGLMQLLRFIKDGGDIGILYEGKFALQHVPLIEELLHLKILKKPYLPYWLNTEKGKEKLKRIRKGIRIKELIN
jgi:uncharacterized protein (TIGR02421 family)